MLSQSSALFSLDLPQRVWHRVFSLIFVLQPCRRSLDKAVWARTQNYISICPHHPRYLHNRGRIELSSSYYCSHPYQYCTAPTSSFLCFTFSSAPSSWSSSASNCSTALSPSTASISHVHVPAAPPSHTVDMSSQLFLCETCPAPPWGTSRQKTLCPSFLSGLSCIPNRHSFHPVFQVSYPWTIACRSEYSQSQFLSKDAWCHISSLCRWVLSGCFGIRQLILGVSCSSYRQCYSIWQHPTSIFHGPYWYILLCGHSILILPGVWENRGASPDSCLVILSLSDTVFPQSPTTASEVSH